MTGGNRRPLRDFCHIMLRLNWPMTLCVVTASAQDRVRRDVFAYYAAQDYAYKHNAVPKP